MAAKKGFTWGEETEPTIRRMEENIQGFLVGELNNQDIWSVTGPTDEKYVIRVTVTLELRPE